ncbi:MAG: hypothetical protein ABI665_09395 [Vicinamibacterales bacterium]
MHEKPKLQCTRDYHLFEGHAFNRPMHDDGVLIASMQRVGFMPSSAIQCERMPNGSLRVIRGHHRLDCAKRLKLPVWYVVDDSNTDLFQLEGGKQGWSVSDFAVSRAQHGNQDMADLLAFQQLHHLTLGAAASLLGGQSAGSGNKIKTVKDGTFKIAADQTHASAVVSITDRCRERGVKFATQSAFVAAVSLVVRVPEFDPEVFLHRVALNGGQMTRRSTVDAYIREIDALYNYQAKGSRIPLAFRAREVSRSRQVDFGRKMTHRKTA